MPSSGCSSAGLGSEPPISVVGVERCGAYGDGDGANERAQGNQAIAIGFVPAGRRLPSIAGLD